MSRSVASAAMPEQDFQGVNCWIVFRPVGVGCIAEDGLPKAGSFGQPDVAADPGLKDLSVSPRPVGRTRLLEEIADVAGHLGRQPSSRLVHADNDPGQPQAFVEPSGDQF